MQERDMHIHREGQKVKKRVLTFCPSLCMYLLEQYYCTQTYIPRGRHTYPEGDIHTRRETYIPRGRHTYPEGDIHTQRETYMHAIQRCGTCLRNTDTNSETLPLSIFHI